MSGYVATYTIGTLVGSEAFYRFEPTGGNERNHGVLLLHGAGAIDQFVGHTRWGSVGLPGALCHEGFVAEAGAMGGDGFGNDSVLTKVETHRLDVIDRYDIANTKVHLVGTSMGGYTALRYAALNPTKVKSLSLFLPLCDIVGAYEADTGGLRDDIGTAFGVTYPTALPSNANLLQIAGQINGFDIPTKFWYDDSDTIIPPASVTQMATITGGTAYELTPDSGHTEAGIRDISLVGSRPWGAVLDHIIAADSV